MCVSMRKFQQLLTSWTSCVWPKHTHCLWHRCSQLRVSKSLEVYLGGTRAEAQLSEQLMDAGTQREVPISVQAPLHVFRYSDVPQCRFPRWQSSCLYQGRGFNLNRAPDSGCSPESQAAGSPWGLSLGLDRWSHLLRSCAAVEELWHQWKSYRGSEQSAMSEGIREWSTSATRTGKKTCIAKHMVLNIWPIINPPEKSIFLIRSTLVIHLLNSFWKEYDLQASRQFCNIRNANFLIHINVNELLLSTLFTPSISFYFHSCSAVFGISYFSSLFKEYSLILEEGRKSIICEETPRKLCQDTKKLLVLIFMEVPLHKLHFRKALIEMGSD